MSIYNLCMSYFTPAVYNVLSLLSLLRNGVPTSELWRGFQKRGMRLQPRLGFWLPLLQKAALLNANLVPSGFVRQWLDWPVFDQSLYLLEAWKITPANRSMRMERRNLLLRLKRGDALTLKDQRELSGLSALGITQDNRLSAWGRVILGLAANPSQLAAQAWHIEDGILRLPQAPGWRLVWDLERYIQPLKPYEYPLTPGALRMASQRGDPQQLLQTLEAGLQTAVPPALMAQISGQPVLHFREGLVLTFSTPDELLRLRSSSALRPYLEQILTLRSVLVPSADAPRLMLLLERRGIYAQPAREEPIEAERPLPPPIKWSTDETRADLRRALEYHLRTQTGMDILYTSPQAHLSLPGYNADRPEQRRITPLLIEERGEYTYVIAYCHTRRGQRTFRLDRMELAELMTNAK